MSKITSILAATLLSVFTAPAVSAQTIEDSGEIFLWNPSTLYQPAFSGDLPGGRQYEVQYRNGLLITENDKSPLYLARIVHRTGRLVETDKGTGEEKLLFRWIMLEATDREGNQIFFWGEHNPPEAPTIRVTEGTGKFAGIRGHLNLGWEPAAKYLDGPDGAIRLDYDIEFKWNADDPSRHLPIHGRQVADETIRKEWSRLEFVMGRSPLDETIAMPNGNTYVFGDEQGFLFTEDKDHPLYGMHAWGPNIAVMGPEQLANLEKGEMRVEECCVYQLGLLVLTDTRGDQIYVLLENRPGVGVTWHGVKGTGQFDGVTFYGRASLYGRPVEEDVFFATERPQRRESDYYADAPGREWPNHMYLDLSYYQFQYAGAESH